MKKVLFGIIAAAFILTAGAPMLSYAGGPTKEGVVKAIDEKAGTMTFTEADKKEMTVKVDKSMVKGIKVGDKVKVMFDDSECNVVARVKPMRTVKVPVGC
jgi:Cu/Ag efflux protein CusF